MTAIVIVPGRCESFGAIEEHIPAPLLPLADKPFLQHLVEALVGQGVRTFDFLLSHLPEKIEYALGDGARWGCHFRYHLLSEGSDPLRLARTIAAGETGNILLGNAGSLPALDLAAVSSGTVIAREGAWAGWAVLSPADFNLPDFEALPSQDAPLWLSIATGADFLRSQRMLLEGAFPGLSVSGRQADPGIWISRNVALHPTARLTPPVYIGENCRIGRGVQLGPSAVIGANCIVDEHTIMIDSLLSAGTYVGEGLELDNVIVDRNRLLNVRLETSLLASEAFLLGSLTGKARTRITQGLLSRIAALLLLLVLWPLLLLTWLLTMLSGAAKAVSRRAVVIPADDDPASWRESAVLRFENKAGRTPGRAGEFFFRFLPGLISVAAGNLHLVGVEPRTREQVRNLPSDWRSLYLGTKAGLVTESVVMFGCTPSEDELFTAEAFYSATESVGRDLRLLGMWLWRVITGFPQPGAPAISLPEDLS